MDGETHSENKPEKDDNYLTIWEEIKQRMQGSFDVLLGKSAAVDFQRLSQLEFSHSIIEDDLSYYMQPDIEHGMEPER